MKIAAKVRPLYDAWQKLAAEYNARGTRANVGVHSAFSSHTPASEQRGEWFTLFVMPASHWTVALSDRASAEIRGVRGVTEPYVVVVQSEWDKSHRVVKPAKTRKAAVETLRALVEQYRDRDPRPGHHAPHANPGPAPTRASLAKAAAQVQAATKRL